MKASDIMSVPIVSTRGNVTLGTIKGLFSNNKKQQINHKQHQNHRNCSVAVQKRDEKNTAAA